MSPPPRPSPTAVDLADRLQRLIALAQALTSARDTDEVLAAVLEATVALLAADGSSLALLDEQRGELSFFAMEGRSKTRPFRIPAERGIAGHVVRTGEAVLSNEVAGDQRFLATIDEQTGFVTTSMACVPILKRGRVAGCMQALNSRRGCGFVEDDLELLSALAGLAGATLERTRIDRTVRTAGAVLRAAEDERHSLTPTRNAAMRAALDVVRAAAASDATVLLLGESGTGKEVAAREVHRLSPRSDGPFVVINCAALAPTLLESELFGHEKGAFTGASQRRLGKFELADGGTLFLDEIGEMPLELQSKLLRALQERELQRVGGNETVRTDVRVVAATNRELKDEVQKGRFRADLFYRLNVVSVTLPPLRERPEDIAVLAAHFVARSSAETKRRPLRLGDDAMALLLRYRWPGNVRELANVMERATVLCAAATITAGDLPAELRAGAPTVVGAAVPSPDLETSLSEAVRSFKVARVREALAACGGNQLRAAARLGLQPGNLSRLMKDLALR